MSVPFYPFHFLLLKLLNKGMSFPFPSLKLPNKGRKEYSKIILFIPFHSIPFPPPKRNLKISEAILNRKIQGLIWRNLGGGLRSCKTLVVL